MAVQRRQFFDSLNRGHESRVDVMTKMQLLNASARFKLRSILYSATFVQIGCRE